MGCGLRWWLGCGLQWIAKMVCRLLWWLCCGGSCLDLIGCEIRNIVHFTMKQTLENDFLPFSCKHPNMVK